MYLGIILGFCSPSLTVVTATVKTIRNKTTVYLPQQLYRMPEIPQSIWGYRVAQGKGLDEGI